MHIAVIVVSHNTRDLLRRCLKSVAASFAGEASRQDRLTLIVVDSASRDGSAEMVADEFPHVQLLSQEDNIGFVAGNNLALRTLGFEEIVTVPSTSARGKSRSAAEPECVLPSPADFVLLLNPDAELIANALWQMVHFLEKNPAAGACGARLRYGDGSFQHGAFCVPSLAQVLLDLLPLSGVPGIQRLHNSVVNGRYPQRLWKGREPFPVDFVLGAALMVKATVIRDVGGLDPDYVMYCEELDWCVRMWRGGWRVYAVPTAHVVHHAGGSSRQVRWPSFVRLWRSRFIFYEKHAVLYPRGYRRVLRVVVRLCLTLRQLQAERRFGRGCVTGLELQNELCAYAAVRAL